MPDISTRINALIAYLFLGPLLLLMKEGTPLGHPFVRGHAKRASLVILIGFISFIVYFSVRHSLSFSIFGITLGTVLLTGIVSSTLFALVVGAYRAYSGVSTSDSTWKSFVIPENTSQKGEYSEETKVRMIASFIPFIGILIASRYPSRENIIGRKIGNIFSFIFLTSVVFFSGNVTTFTLILTVGYIALIVFTAVQVFIFSSFFEFTFYKKIPTYLEFDAHFKASIVSIFDFFRIAFGGEKNMNYIERYNIFLEKNIEVKGISVPYFAPKWIIAIPGINLITLPSLGQSKYSEYTSMILQGFIVTVCLVLVILFYGIGSQMGLYLLFPILTLLVESSNTNVRAPFTSIVADFVDIFSRGKDRIAEIKENGKEKVEFKYEVEEEISQVEVPSQDEKVSQMKEIPNK
ncbi:hypothetical protein HOO68_04525 [Candidatus Gracilibacteria bacterium]|nr:hypothetical protein [Candidatus Gracilibacteria bacterium]